MTVRSDTLEPDRLAVPGEQQVATSSTMPHVPRISPLGALRVLDPDRWAKTIRGAMKKADGRIEDAAVALGVSRRTLFRLLEDPAFSDVVRAPTGKHRGGR